MCAFPLIAARMCRAGEPGLIAIPCILSHLTQIFADAFLAAKWSKITEAGTYFPARVADDCDCLDSARPTMGSNQT